MSEETDYKWTKNDYCAIAAAIVLFGVGILISIFITNSIPDFALEHTPTIILWMPAIVLAFPLLICFCLMRGANKRHKEKAGIAGVHRYRDETIVYTGDYQIDSEAELKEPEKVYLIPTECPSCNISINEESVDWVGPMKAKCPHCEAIIEVKEKTF
ncbi:MAG: hypothetical protein RTU63_11635 [Candidatus Thorarchaeota archaeon]